MKTIKTTSSQLPNKTITCLKSLFSSLPIEKGTRLMFGGFGLCGIPEKCIEVLSQLPIQDLTVISNNIGNSGRGLAILLQQRKIKKAICSYVGGNPDLEQQIAQNLIEVELVPQGTFSERIRIGGMGIGGFYTPTGVGTIIEEGKEKKKWNGVEYLLELPLKGDIACIKAQKADTFGNLWFKESARNFSPLMAMACTTTIVEVEELVPVGEIPPENVHLPGIFVNFIFLGTNYQNSIEFLKTEILEGKEKR